MATSGTKRRKLAHRPGGSDPASEGSAQHTQKSFFKNASSWDLEQDYESRPRKGKKKDKDSNRLPIKNREGQLEVLQSLQDDEKSIDSDTEWLEGREEDMEADSEPEPAKKEKDKEPEIPVQQQIVQAQEELAKLAMAVNENPEENVSAFKALAEIGETKIPAIQMLALMTQMTVYKDIIPGYRIRPAEDFAKEKLSKEVRQLRQYEQSLISGYQNYIKELARLAKLPAGSSKAGPSLPLVAVTCACTLITSVPHFNFRTDLLRILVGRLSKRNIDEAGRKSLEALETLCREDEEGRPSLEAVSLLTKMMKAKDFHVHESVLNLFLSLRLLSEFAGTASQDAVDRDNGPKQKKKHRDFRTKRERKAVKEQKALEKDMANADALVSHEERERMQSETLKLVFATYFRTLKMRVPHLMGAVLEGLAKYAHLINQDFFGDLLEALKDLIRYSDEEAENGAAGGKESDDEDVFENESDASDDDEEEQDSEPDRNLSREALLCIVTAFALLAGQDAHNSRGNLHLDLSHFITHLFTTLLPLSTNPNLELTRLASSTSATSKINVQTTTVLLLRSLTGVLLPPYNIRSVPPLRLAAFTKQLMTVALQLPEKSCQGVLALLGDVAHTHSKKVRSLWNTEERKGDGRFHPLGDSVEGSNPFAATVWEGELLRKHFSPKVREGIKLLEKGMSS